MNLHNDATPIFQTNCLTDLAPFRRSGGCCGVYEPFLSPALDGIYDLMAIITGRINLCQA